jgi:hypothetical protein
MEALTSVSPDHRPRRSEENCAPEIAEGSKPVDNWGFRVRACAPYRARTKGKDERGVGYVKRNAVAGRSFASFAGLEAHLDAWTREVADQRTHGTTGEAPAERFARDEAGALTPLGGVPPFTTALDLVRRVGADCAVAVDGNAYSVPWRLIGEAVRVTVSGARVRVQPPPSYRIRPSFGNATSTPAPDSCRSAPESAWLSS